MDEHNLSFEPMEIDVSAHSSNKMDISFNESYSETNEFLMKINESVTKSTPTPVKTELINLVDNNTNQYSSIKKFHINIPKQTTRAFNIAKIRIICSALVLLLSVIAYQVLNIQCSDININMLRKNLESKLYGQTKAIDELIEGLSSNERSKVIILYGSTGVGKTFVASTIMELVGQYSNVYHYTMPSFMETFTTDFMVGLTVCKNSIIIVDDLSPGDLDVKVHIGNLIAKSEKLEKDVSVLLIYNCVSTQEFNRKSEIMDNLKSIKAFKKIIRFETLSVEHLKKCIETELGHRKISNDEFQKVLKNFDVAVDGCKGVHMKMKLMGLS